MDWSALPSSKHRYFWTSMKVIYVQGKYIDGFLCLPHTILYMQAKHRIAQEKSLLFCELPTSMLTTELSYTLHCPHTLIKWQPICSTEVFICFAIAKHTRDTCLPYKKTNRHPGDISVCRSYINCSPMISPSAFYFDARSKAFLSGQRIIFQCLTAFCFSLLMVMKLLLFKVWKMC